MIDIYEDELLARDPTDTSRDLKYGTRPPDHVVGGSYGSRFDDERGHQVNSNVSDELSGMSSRRLSALSDAGNAGKAIIPGTIVRSSNEQPRPNDEII